MKDCDITKVGIITELLRVPQPRRDANWRHSFYSNVIDASFACGNPQLIAGPDGFPYFALLSPEPSRPFESFCIYNLLEPATNDGFGIAINPSSSGVDWVFTYGDLLTFRMFNSFEVSQASAQGNLINKELIKKGEEVFIGAPSEDFLPTYARKVIKHFLEENLGLTDVGVFLMYRPSDSPEQQLVFSIFPEQFAREEELYYVLGRISWFLPRHYPVVAISKEDELAKSFYPL